MLMAWVDQLLKSVINLQSIIFSSVQLKYWNSKIKLLVVRFRQCYRHAYKKIDYNQLQITTTQNGYFIY